MSNVNKQGSWNVFEEAILVFLFLAQDLFYAVPVFLVLTLNRQLFSGCTLFFYIKTTLKGHETHLLQKKKIYSEQNQARPLYIKQK